MRAADWRALAIVVLVVAINVASCINRNTLHTETRGAYDATLAKCSEAATLCEAVVIKCETAVDLLASATCQELP